MSHDEWLQERRGGIGGSDVSIILGLNKYKAPFELWLDKTGQSNVEDSAGEAAYFGNKLEEFVAKEFEIRTGKKVRRNNFMLQHPEHDFITANIDRKVVGEDALLECKTASAFLAKDWESDEIPDAYLVQVQHYLGVTGYKHAYIAVLIGGQKFIWKDIERDEELIKMIFDAEVRFWNDHVLANVPPALDGSSAAEKFLKERYEKEEAHKTVDLAFEYKKKLDRLQEIKEEMKQKKEEEKEIKNNLMYEMKDAEIGFVNNYEVNWKTVTQNRIDTKRLKKEKPEVYESFLKQIDTRPLKIKEIG